MTQIDSDSAGFLGIDPCYIYLRPFAKCFLRTLSKRYNIYLYSELNPKILNLLIELFKQYEINFSGAYCNESGSVKDIHYFTDTNPEIDLDQILIIDHNPAVLGANYNN